jgi:HEPN domain-containing protein
MRPDEEAKASAESWLEYATRDLRAASVLSGEPDLSGAACFHAQQAAEKALKALLAWLSDEDIPRTHDLLHLNSLIVERGGPQLPRNSLRVLSQHAVASRYPEIELPTDREAAQARQLAEEVVNQVRQAVGMLEL